MKNANDLVLVNNEIKLRLQIERQASSNLVHVDWIAFTVQMRHAPVPTVETLFPSSEARSCSYAEARLGLVATEKDLEREAFFRQYHREKIVAMLRELEDEDYTAHTQAFQMAEDVAAILGPDFIANSELCRGLNFYKHRYNIERCGRTVGWVGFLSVAKGARSEAQAKTIHVNLEGMACTFAQAGWREELADYIDDHRGLITRCDLALDFFQGVAGGWARFKPEYDAGLMDHMGRRPKAKAWDEWDGLGEGRSIYLGSRQAGKLTNIYEKGKQLFGAKDATDWTRIELRYGNQKRILPTDLLRNPDGCFAGASAWHATMLGEAGAMAAPLPIKTEPRLPEQTILAECVRNARWAMSTAGKSLALALKHLDFETLLGFVDNCAEMPNRLSKFSKEEVEKAYAQAFKQVSASGSGRTGSKADQAITEEIQ